MKFYQIKNTLLFKSLFLPIICIFIAVSLIIFSQGNNIPNKITSFFVFSAMFFLLYVIYIYIKIKNFSYSIGEEYIFVKELSKPPINIFYSDINKVWIRQSPIDRLMNISSLYLVFQSQNEIKLQVFGKSIRILSPLELPGIWGNNLIISGLDPKDAEEIKNIIMDLCKRNIEVRKITFGDPYYNLLIGLVWIISISLTLIIIIFLLFVLFVYYKNRYNV